MGELRIKACVEAWPGCRSGEYNPRCCRFPKSCSCTSYRDEIDPALLEDPPVEHHVGTLDLSGEGNRAEVASPIPQEAVAALAASLAWSASWDNYGEETRQVLIACSMPTAQAALEAAYPAIREQVAEEIAVAIADAEGFNGTCDCQDCVSTGRLVDMAREIGAGGARGPAEGSGGKGTSTDSQALSKRLPGVEG